MSELLELTAAQAAEGVRTGTVDPGALWTAYRERALADELNAFSWVSGEVTPPEVERNAPLGRRPARRQGPLLHRGHPEPGRLEDPRGLPAALHRHRRRAPHLRRRAAAGQDPPGRVRDGLLDRELRLRPGPQPVGPLARARRLLGRLGRRRGVGRGAVGDRHRHRRLDPPARGAVRDRRAQADLRRGLALRDDRLRLLARPGRPADARRHRLRAAVRRHGRPGPVRLDLARLPGAGRPADRDRPARRAPRRARGALRRRHRARRAQDVPRDPRPRARPRRRDRRHHAPARPARARRLLPDRARPRRRPTSRATTASATGCASPPRTC